MKTQLTRIKKPSAGLARVSVGTIERRIHLIRGQRVMLDSDLAKLYHVTTAFNQAVKRNTDRFPADFMFQLTPLEARSLRSQSVILDNLSETARGRHRKYTPHVFTEHGIAMLSSVLRSKRAVQMNIQIVRAFIRLRELLAEHKDLATRVDKLESAQKRQVSVIRILADEIQDMKNPTVPSKRRIGFRTAD